MEHELSKAEQQFLDVLIELLLADVVSSRKTREVPIEAARTEEDPCL